MPSSSTTIISKCIIYPDQKSTMKPLKLSVSDLPMLSCHYIQKGVLLSSPPHPFDDVVESLKLSLSATLSLFPALAGRLSTDAAGHVHILCNDAGVDFLAANAKHLTVATLLSPPANFPDVHPSFKEFFAYDTTISYSGHNIPLAAVQVTELADGIFVGCTVNHAVTDGTSFWHFFNTFAAVTKAAGTGAKKKLALSPDFTRDTVFDTAAVLPVPAGGPAVTFAADEPLRERVFHFSREAIQRLKQKVNHNRNNRNSNGDGWKTFSVNGNGNCNGNGRVTVVNGRSDEISSFQSLSAQLWRSVTRARKLDASKTSTFRMAVNCRHRLEPKMDPLYFGNAIQSIPTVATVEDIVSEDASFCAELLHRNVVVHDDATVRRGVEDWEKAPRLFPLGNFDGAMITMGSSPRFPMYDNDFGWGRPLAIRSGKANKFDGKISAFPGREGNGSVDLEVVLAPETMAGLENDTDFMQYVTPAE